MNPRSWLHIATFAAVGTVLAVAAVAIPAAYWTASVIAAVLLFAAAVGFFFLLPKSGGGRGDAANFALLGPTGALTSLLLLWSGASIFVALPGYATASWAMDVVTIGGFIVAWSLLKVASQVVSHAAQAAETPSSHSLWQNQVSALVHTASDDAARKELAGLAESIRYAARDSASQTPPENAQVTESIQALRLSVDSADAQAISKKIRSIQSLLAQREQSLKSLRSRV